MLKLETFQKSYQVFEEVLQETNLKGDCGAEGRDLALDEGLWAYGTPVIVSWVSRNGWDRSSYSVLRGLPVYNWFFL